MNTEAQYRYQGSFARPTALADTSQTASQPSSFVLQGDPSLPAQPQARTGRRIAWVRPTELHTFAGHLIGRGIDLHAELVRRAHRAPGDLARSAYRLAPTIRPTRTPSSAPPALTARQEGPQL